MNFKPAPENHKQKKEIDRLLMEEAPDAILILDETAGIIDANTQACFMLGYSRGELPGLSSREILPAELQTFIKQSSKTQKSADSFRGEGLIKKKDGIFLQAEFSSKMLSDGNFMAIVRDISERKLVEEKIKTSEKNLRQALTSTTDVFYVIDRNCRITLINPVAEESLEKAWGRPVSTGTNILDLVPDEKDEPVLTSLKKVFNGESVEYELFVSVQGLPAWVLVTYTPVHDDQGKISGAAIITKNISERKYAEEELKRSHSRFEMISRTTNDAVWDWDLETGKLWSNETHQHLYGLTLSDPVPSEEMWAQRIHPGDRDTVVGTQQRILASDKNVFISEYRFYTEKNGYRDIYDRCYIVRDAKGKAVRMMGSMMDITERKKFESELKESEARYRSLIEQASDFIMITDQKGNFIDANSNFYNSFGYTREELTRLDITHVIDAEQLKNDPVRFDLLVKGQTILRERRMKRKDGTIIEVEANVKMLPDGRIMAIARDIRDRKQAELAIRTSEETRKLIMNAALDAIVCIDTAGMITVWTPQARKIFGWDEDEVIGKTLTETIIPVQYRERHKRGIDHYLQTGEHKILNRLIEISALHKDGKEFPVELSITPVKQGITSFFCAFIRDITERKEAEMQLSNERNLLRALIDHLPDYIYVKDTSFNYIISNRAFVKLVGASSEAATIGKKSTQLFGQEVGGVNMQEDKSVFETGKEISDRDEIILTAEGKKLWLLTTKVPLKDQDKKVIGILGISKDITERKKSEEEIARSNARFNIVSKATSDIVWDWDLLTNAFWWNDNYYSNLGFAKKDEIDIDDWFHHIHPDDVSRVRAKIIKTIEGSNTAWRDEYRYANADGTYLHFLDRSFIMRDNNGVATRMIGSMVDMTPIYNAQREVAESENRLRTILDSDPECIKLLGPDSELYEINKAGLEMIEADSLEEIKGRSLLMLIDEPQREAAAKLVKEAFNDQSGRIEFEMITLKGNKRWCESRIVPFRNAEGEITYALSVTIDNTEKRKAELELKQNEEKYRTLVEQAIDAIALYDEKGKILDVNTGAVNLLRYTKEELTGMSLAEILTQEEIQINPVRYDILENGSSTVKQRKMRRKDGTIVETEVRSQQLPDGRFLSVIRDMSERIRTEEELETSYRAIRKLTAHLQNIREEERTHIAREIHDELGQQLTVLKMDVSWINKKISSTADDSTREKMKELLEMLDDTVRTVRRISSELRPSLLDDLGLMAAMEWQLNEFEKRSGIKTKLEAPEKEIKLSNPLKTALFRIFQESLTNVARHSSAQKMVVSLSQTDDHFVLSIIDDGMGFDKEKIADKRTLGILGMKERSTMIGGTYEIISYPGKGTRVSVSVPLDAKEQKL